MGATLPANPNAFRTRTAAGLLRQIATLTVLRNHNPVCANLELYLSNICRHCLPRWTLIANLSFFIPAICKEVLFLGYFATSLRLW